MESPILDCLNNDLTPEEYLALRLCELNCSLKRRYADVYIAKYGEPDSSVIGKLVERGFVYAPFKDKPPYNFFDVLYKKVDKNMMLELAEEFWDNYPATFPLSNGNLFIARAGCPKSDLLNRYMELINWDEEKHKHVIHQVKRYERLVMSGKINGYKIIDWVSAEMWDAIASIPEEKEVNTFKEDV